jgi:hypothetical protein
VFEVQLVIFSGRETIASTIRPNVVSIRIISRSRLVYEVIEFMQLLKSLGGQRDMESISWVVQVKDILHLGKLVNKEWSLGILSLGDL